MHMTRHTLLVGLLTVILALTSVTIATARGQAAPTGTMVICSGQGNYTVLVDEDGQPTGAVHLCPDCALSLFAMGAGQGELTEPLPVWRSQTTRSVRAGRSGIPTQPPKARGPPVLI